jgi:periodic tryptophan protein 2
VCSDIRPDGKVVVCGTLSGSLYFWRIEDGTLLHIIDGQKDIAGGRKVNDRMASKNNAASRYFTSVCFSADGQCVLAGGNSKHICIYEVSQQILLKKFQFTYNRSLDGVLDELNSKNLADGGPMDALAEGAEDDNDLDPTSTGTLSLPGAKRVNDGGRKHKIEVLTTNVAFSPTGRDWAVVSGEGLHIYSLDDDMMFDPVALMEAITPAAVALHLQKKHYSQALIMSMHLNESELVQQVLDATPYSSIPHVVEAVTSQHLECLMQFLTVALLESPHVEFYVEWCLQVLQTHGGRLQKNRPKYMRAFRAMFKILQTKQEECKTICDNNRYTLDFIVEQSQVVTAATAAVES